MDSIIGTRCDEYTLAAKEDKLIEIDVAISCFHAQMEAISKVEKESLPVEISSAVAAHKQRLLSFLSASMLLKSLFETPSSGVTSDQELA